MDMLRNVAEARTVTVLRDGKETEIYMPEISLLDIAKEEPMFLDILRPNVVDSVIAGGPLAIAGVQKGDSILAVNNMPVGSWNEFTENWKASVRMLKPTERNMPSFHWFIRTKGCAILLQFVLTLCLW